MRRFGFWAALGLAGRARAAGEHPLLERLAARRRGLDDGTHGAFDGAASRVALPFGASSELDLSYGGDPAQRLDVYRPAAAQAAAVILYVHGGGWVRGDKAMPQMVQNKLPHWLWLGCIVVSTNYRMLPAAGVLEQADDVARALAFVQRNAGGWGGDGGRVVLVGHSAGAHLAALVAADPAIGARQGVAAWRATLALDSAALDMVAIMSRRHYHFYDPVFGADPGFWREASPTHRLQAGPAAPMLLVCSSLREDSAPPAREFAAKATALGGRVTVHEVALSHRDINDQLGLPGAYTQAVDVFLKTVGVP